MWWWILIVLLFLFVTMLLFIPLQLYINTATNDYFVRIGHLAKGFLEADDKEIIQFRIRVIGYQFYLYPLRMKSPGKKEKKLPKKTASRRKFEAQKLFRILKAFKINRFELSIDTGNYVTNAQLYPFFGFVNHHFAKCQINFEGINYLIFDVRSRPFTVLKAFINH